MVVEFADNGCETVEIIHTENHQFDIVVMNIMIPTIDSYEAIDLTKKKKEQVYSIQLSPNNHVGKPTDMDKLILRI